VFALPSDGRPTVPTRPATAGAASKAAPAEWAAAEPFTFTFQGYDAGRFRVEDPIVASTAYQIARVYKTAQSTTEKPASPPPTTTVKGKVIGGEPSFYSYLTVFRPGAFNSAGIRGGKTLTVAGHQAVRANLPVGLDPKSPIDPGNKLLAWEYADNAWASVTSISSDADDPSFEELTALVAGLKPSTPRPAKLPFKVGYLPGGYQPVQIGTHALPGLSGISGARDGDHGGATFARPAPATTGLTAPFDGGPSMIKGSFDIFVTPSRNSNQPAQAGRTKCYPNGFCNVWSADGKVQVQVSLQGTGAKLPEAELKRIAQSIKVADVTDEATWTPAATALQP
jgi:hypothetical protein